MRAPSSWKEQAWGIIDGAVWRSRLRSRSVCWRRAAGWRSPPRSRRRRSRPPRTAPSRRARSKRNGQLRLVANASKCTKHEQVVTWNQKGPGGTADDPGSVVVGALTLGPDADRHGPIHAFSFGATNTRPRSAGRRRSRRRQGQGGGHRGPEGHRRTDARHHRGGLHRPAPYLGRWSSCSTPAHHAARDVHLPERVPRRHAAVQRRRARAAHVRLREGHSRSAAATSGTTSGRTRSSDLDRARPLARAGGRGARRLHASVDAPRGRV